MKIPNSALWTALITSSVLMLAVWANLAPLSPDPASDPAAAAMAAASASDPGSRYPGAGGLQSPSGTGYPVDGKALESWLLRERIEDARQARLEKLIKTGLGGLFSSIILVSALVVIFRRASSSDEKNWAFGSIGAILGFWIGR